MKKNQQGFLHTQKGKQLCCLFAWLALAGAVVMVAAGVRPTSWRIPCLFRLVLGIRCLGCGGTRVLELMLQGDFAGALYYHPLLTAAAAAAIVWLAVATWRSFQKERRPLKQPNRHSVFWGMLLAAGLLMFVVIRNLPLYQRFFY